MSVGDRLAGYVAGLEAGYFVRVGEENERWRRKVATSRVSVVEAPQFVMVNGERVKRWTWRERKADRLATLAEAHAAGLHADRPADRAGCPGCSR